MPPPDELLSPLAIVAGISACCFVALAATEPHALVQPGPGPELVVVALLVLVQPACVVCARLVFEVHALELDVFGFLAPGLFEFAGREVSAAVIVGAAVVADADADAVAVAAAGAAGVEGGAVVVVAIEVVAAGLRTHTLIRPDL